MHNTFYFHLIFTTTFGSRPYYFISKTLHHAHLGSMLRVYWIQMVRLAINDTQQ